MKEHWNEIYEALDIEELPWQEEIPEPSIKLLSNCLINKDEPIWMWGQAPQPLWIISYSRI